MKVFLLALWASKRRDQGVQRSVLVVGGGPAGLRAAEVAAMSGEHVILVDQKRSVGRKFLVAGKSGLNLTHSDSKVRFLEKYDGCRIFWEKAWSRFDNQAVQQWAKQLGIETFEATSGRIYPSSMKGAPLLRRWVLRLKELGVEFQMNRRLVAIRGQEAVFHDGETISFGSMVMALGGGSWPATGSDGEWQQWLRILGVQVKELAPANCGWEVAWPPDLAEEIEGLPLKNISVRTPDQRAVSSIGELVCTRYGLEGGPLYQIGNALRQMIVPRIFVDLKPDQTREQLRARMGGRTRGFWRESKYRWKLNEAARCLLRGFCRNLDSLDDYVEVVKGLEVPFVGPRPLAEAISSAGGVIWDDLDEALMLKMLPGVFVAGEMIDWEAPTGGYLLQGCLMTGTVAGEAAVRYLKVT